MKVLTSLLLVLSLAVAQAADQATIRVGSKNFGENYLLAEIMSQMLEGAGYKVERSFGLGGTLVCYEALLNDEIDVYPEYSGTISQAILKTGDLAPTQESINGLLDGKGVRVLSSFGFNNTYAMAVKQGFAAEKQLTSISDLRGRTDVNISVSLEFLNREDGWPGLASTYGLTQSPGGIDHGLAYQAIAEGKIDLTDAYSTDGDLERYGLVVLDDDRGYFPQYLGMPFVRNDLPDGATEVLAQLQNGFDDERMRALNAEVVVNGRSFGDVAAQYIAEQGLVGSAPSDNEMWHRLLDNTLTHLKLTAIALTLGCLAGLPIGVLVYRLPTVSRMTVYVAGLLQTVPSIALLALMIPLFGIGQTPAIIALFLYSILPILRNTVTALLTIDPLLKRVAEAIGLTRSEQLRFVLIPLALPTILSGVKTAAVISIGTATLAAFIGAGGLGEPIVTGLALNDTGLILQGAIPAACLAIVVELLFEGLEKLLVKQHMTQELPQ